jgi:uncharacterized Zn ribbon protein
MSSLNFIQKGAEVLDMPGAEDGTVVCDKCETEYSVEDEDSCPNCSSSMTRPDFVIDTSYVRDAPPMYVQVSDGFGLV